jgi:hypothetical protein
MPASRQVIKIDEEEHLLGGFQKTATGYMLIPPRQEARGSDDDDKDEVPPI